MERFNIWTPWQFFLFCCVDPNVCLDLLPDGGIDGIIGDALAASPSWVRKKSSAVPLLAI